MGVFSGTLPIREGGLDVRAGYLEILMESMNLTDLLVYLNEDIQEKDTLQEVALVEDMDEAASYPEGFDINTLKTLPGFAKKTAYITKYLTRLGSGSSRIVFAADNGLVLKIAKNVKGIAQNEVEFDVSQYADDNGFEDLIAMVRESDPDNLWLESERARKSTAADWQRILGVNQRTVLNAIWNIGNSRTLSPAGQKMPPAAKEFLQSVRTFAEVNDMPAGDLARPSSWGIVTRGGKELLVLVDYGLTKEVGRQHYWK